MGEAFAKILALNGVTVVVCDFNASSAVANEIRSIGGEARPSVADVSNAETMSKIVRSVKVN